MQFNNTTTKSGIIQQIEQVTGLGDGTISGNTYRLATFTNLINNWGHATNHWLHQVDGERPYDDENHGDFNIEEFSFVDSQYDYKLTSGGESDSLVVKKIEIWDVSAGKYFDAGYLDAVDRLENEFGGDKGLPSKYYMNGNSAIFDIKPDTTKTTKFRVAYDRNASVFLVSDTTKQPGFDLVFHPILVYGPALDWAFPLGRVEIVNLAKTKIYGTDPENDIGLKRMAEEYYAGRLAQKIPKIARRKRSMI